MKSYHNKINPSLFDEYQIGHHNLEHAIFNPPVSIETAGVSRWGADRSFSRTNSEIFGIEQITMGNAIFLQNSREYTIWPGGIFILRKGSQHRYRVGSAGFLHKRFITLSGPLLDQLTRLTGLYESDVILPNTPAEFTHLLKAAYILLKEGNSQNTEKISLLAYEILLGLGKELKHAHPQELTRVLDYIQKNLDRPLTNAELAKEAGCSQTHFYRLFQKHFKVSPMQFFIAQRLNWAGYLLKNSARTIKEIAITCGYDEPLYFSAQFKKFSGVSPKHFRNADAGEA